MIPVDRLGRTQGRVDKSGLYNHRLGAKERTRGAMDVVPKGDGDFRTRHDDGAVGNYRVHRPAELVVAMLGIGTEDYRLHDDTERGRMGIVKVVMEPQSDLSLLRCIGCERPWRHGPADDVHLGYERRRLIGTGLYILSVQRRAEKHEEQRPHRAAGA